MKYIEIVNLVFSIIFGIFGLLTIHYVIFAIIGFFKKKKYPKTEVRNRYGLIIPARNEELVVGGLISSILENDYPQDKLEIFVIAHNCTDKTAEIARSYGKNVHVYEYNNEDEKTMGYAFRYLFKKIEEDYGTQNFDGFFLFNADNVVAKDYFTRMNEAFEYYGKNNVITSYRNSKNFGTNLISGLYGLYFTVGSIFEARGRTDLGCSTRVQGTGYVIPSSLVKNGWKYVTLTEDWEFSADQIIDNNMIKYCDAAVFYDEQPTNAHIMWRQRVRWSRGHLLVFYARLGDLIRHVFSKGNKHRFSSYDILINTLPVCLNYLILSLLQILCLSIAPLIDSNVTLYDAFISNNLNILTSSGYLITSLRSIIIYCIVTIFEAAACFIAAGKRVQGVSIFKKIILCILWPLFLFLQFPIDIQAFFSKNLGWKTIPHSDNTKVETSYSK